MKLQAYTHEELFALGRAIVRSVTGVEYPFSEKTFHRALLQVQAMFGANANMETLRMIKGGSLEGLTGQLLDRRALQNSTVREPPQAARVAGRFQRAGASTTEGRAIPPATVILRPSTATQSEVAFRTEAAATIAVGDTQSNLVFAVATETGEKGNVIPSGAQLQLRTPISDVDYFLTDRQSGGGQPLETDDNLRVRARTRAKAVGEATWLGIETLLGTVELSTGQRITAARVFEAFDEVTAMGFGRVYAIIDDGSGDASLIGVIDDTTYGPYDAFASNPYYEYEEQSYHIYVDLPEPHLASWSDGVDAALQRDSGSGYVAQTEGTDYWVDIDRGVIAMATPLTVGHKLRMQFEFYTGLVKEAAYFVNGIVGSDSIRGWRPVGYSTRIRPPTSVVKPSVNAAMVFKAGWDSVFGRTLGATNVLAYLDGLNIGYPARYDVIGGILHKTPGVDYVSGLLLDGGTTDVAAADKFGVVRGDPSTINL